MGKKLGAFSLRGLGAYFPRKCLNLGSRKMAKAIFQHEFLVNTFEGKCSS